MQTVPYDTKSLKTKFTLFLRIALLGFLVLLLLIPTFMVRGLINERAFYQNDIVRGIAQSWGDRQSIGGPVLVVPYKWREKTQYTDNKNIVRTEIVEHIDNAYFLPETLKISGSVPSKILTRHGIFQVPVYEAQLQVEGRFLRPNFAALEIEEADVVWDKAFVLIKASQPKGLREGVTVDWNGSKTSVSPLIGTADLLGTNLSARVPMTGAKDVQDFDFKFAIKAAGSQDLEFIPLGNDTQVHLESDWPHPNFSGDYLPTDRNVTEKGFTADWQVSGLGRNLPQQFKRGDIRQESLIVPSFQTTFMKPVDIYQLSDRAAKYSVLFIFLTFLGFFLFEILGKLKVHPVQYLLVGFALCLFYLLLLSLSEHIAFAASYAIAATATVALITAYMSRLLRFRKTLLLSGVLSGLYAYLYNLLQAEDGSLLMGSIGLFAILALVMFLTRKIDWYSVSETEVPATPQVAS